MRLVSIFSAAILGMGAVPAASQTTSLTPPAAYVSSAMASHGDTKIVVMDKKRGMLSILENGEILMEFRALYGRGKGDDIKIDRRTTPAGIFAMTLYRINPKEYEGGLGYAFQCTDTCYMIHPTWKGDPSEKREQRLASDTPADNAISRIGCINISKPDFDKLNSYLKANMTLPISNGQRVMNYPKLVVLPETQDIHAIAKILGFSGTNSDKAPQPN